MSNEYLRRPDASGHTGDGLTSITSTTNPEPSPLAEWWRTPASEHRRVDAVDPAIFGLDADEVGAAGTPSVSAKAGPTSKGSVADSIRGEIDRATKDAVPADEATHRHGLVDRIKSVPEIVLRMIEGGNHDALELLQPEKAPESSTWSSMLAFAAAIAVGGIAGAAAVMVGEGVSAAAFQSVTPAKRKFVEDAIKEAVKRGLSSKPSATSGSYQDLKQAFREQLTAQRNLALIELNASFSAIHDRLSGLATADLEVLAGALTATLASHNGALSQQVMNKTVLAWTNFIAQAKHGAMGSWDLWERNGGRGAIALDGATPRPGSEEAARAATAANIDPRSVSTLHRAEDHEHFGILEISTTPRGGLLEDGRGMHYGHGYGMRLENVGPEVRKRISTLGRVRDVPLNKLVRVYETHSHSVTPAGSFLITADGHVRRYDLAPVIHPDLRPVPLKEQLGLEHRPVRVDLAKTELRVADLAELVQDLSLSRLAV